MQNFPKVVLVMDTHLLSMSTNVKLPTIVDLINKNICILWSSRMSYNYLSSEARGVSRQYQESGIKFTGEIVGLLGTFKNMKQFRYFFRNKPWLNLPVVYIDSDMNSIHNGGWDCALPIQEYMACPDMSINVQVLDVLRLMNDIVEFAQKWHASV